MPEHRTRSGRLRRGERMVVMAYHLLGAPHRLFSLGTFVEMLSAAKSTISEDLGFMRQAFDRFRLGKVETLPGAAVGGRYRALRGEKRVQQRVVGIFPLLSGPTPQRTGWYLYEQDITSN